MVEGEFHSILKIYKSPAIPTFAPKPLAAWGKFKNAATNTYFFLRDSVEMPTDLLDPVMFCSRVAQLHRGQIRVSHGQFQGENTAAGRMGELDKVPHKTH